MDDWPLTDEQQVAVDAFGTGADLLIEAGAGAGKTSTVVAMARAEPDRTGAYLAFNKALADEAARRVPGNVDASTVHSRAWRAVMGDQGVNHPLNQRLRGGKRLKRSEEARMLGVDDWVATTPYGSKRFSRSYMAGYVMRGVSRFCQTDDPKPLARHLPTIPVLDPAGQYGHRGPNNWAMAEAHVDAMVRAWDDLRSNTGRLRFMHEHYLKSWQLSDPKMDVDFLLVDEAQDLSPVMRSIALNQRDHGVQVVLVGDPGQSIYGFTGAVNAMADLAESGADRVTLTRSFRFGPAVAGVANVLLDQLDESDLRIVGFDDVPSTIGTIDDTPDCILTRTNAKAVSLALSLMAGGAKVAIAKALRDNVTRFAEAALQLQNEGWTPHPELAPFASWDEVVRFTKDDIAGDELVLMVRLIEEFTVERILAELRNTVSARQADVELSTAHTSKGREWDRVRIASDFPQAEEDEPVPPMEPEELRLLYVAVTRAKLRLDLDELPWLDRLASTANERNLL